MTDEQETAEPKWQPVDIAEKFVLELHFKPGLLSGCCKSKEDDLKALYKDTDDQIVECNIEMNEVLVFCCNFLSLLQSQHQSKVEDYGN